MPKRMMYIKLYGVEVDALTLVGLKGAMTLESGVAIGG